MSDDTFELMPSRRPEVRNIALENGTSLADLPSLSAIQVTICGVDTIELSAATKC